MPNTSQWVESKDQNATPSDPKLRLLVARKCLEKLRVVGCPSELQEDVLGLSFTFLAA